VLEAPRSFGAVTSKEVLMARIFRVIAMLAIPALLLAACNTTTETTDDGVTDDAMAPRSVTIQMVAQSDSGQDGTALLTEEDGQTRVVIELANSPEGPQPIHIHDGNCVDLGGIAYDLGTLMNGRVEILVDVSLGELLAGMFAINGHMSPEDMGTYISCGDIVDLAPPLSQ
jgi:hypothetical protein